MPPIFLIVLAYDPLNRLVEAVSKSKKIAFLYDPLGRCLNRILSQASSSGWEEKENEHYLYHGQNEIGAFISSGGLKSLRILGMGHKNTPSTIAIELGGQVLAPITDLHNVRGLIDPTLRSIASKYEFTAFGEERLEDQGDDLYNPWRFGSKRFDPVYDPEFGRWLTTDPEGFVDSYNLYQYVFNNPFRYQDPDGRFVFAIPLLIWGAELALPTISAILTPIIYGAITGVVVYGGYKAGEMLNESSLWKNTDVYAPDRPLPQTPHGAKIPDTDTEHTQLGTKEGSKGKYPQAREFDENGKPVRDIDFTDHGRPHNHTNPHQHRWDENPTGGSRSRERTNKPLENWSYE